MSIELSFAKAISLALLLLAVDTIHAADKLNVLFIAADDMRPQLGCYGDSTVKSPNLDALAKRGILFNRSYVQQALCSPSRICLLSGRYPATTKIFEIGRPLRATMPDIVTLPQHFKNYGYHTRSFGKIYHVGIDDDDSWTVPAWHSKKPRTSEATRLAIAKYIADAKANGIEIPQKGKGNRNSAIPAFEAVDCNDDDLHDGDCAANAIAQLREHAKNAEQPFFLAVGFANPHVPWIAPKKYFELYNLAQLPLAKNEFLPKGAPTFAATSGTDFYWYKDVPQVSGDQIPDEYKRNCLQGYLAAISYVDAQVGRLLATLDETGLAKNTLIVFWSDHGYYMGEHTWWGAKHNNYEGATRNCLIIAKPGQKHAGSTTEALVQSVDLAPTLTKMCELPPNPGFEGTSLAAILEDPAREINDAAYSWYPKSGYLGLAMRTDKWRYVEWTKPGEPTVRELYNMVHDTQNDLNVADKPEHEPVMKSLSRRMREKFPIQDLPSPKDEKQAIPKQ